MEDSIFTKIIRGEIPSYKIYEDEKNIAFLDIFPDTAGHVLVVPKVQTDRFYDLPDGDYEALFRAVKKIAKRMETVLGARILMRAIGTDVPHVHIHLTPYDETWTAGRKVKMTEREFEKMAERLRK